MNGIDITYAPRPWTCNGCGNVLGVVMRNTKRVRSLYVFYICKTMRTMPTQEELFNCPRGMFIAHGIDWCRWIECPICGDHKEWNLRSEIAERIRK